MTVDCKRIMYWYECALLILITRGRIIMRKLIMNTSYLLNNEPLDGVDH